MDNYYARFGNHSYHCFREIHLNARLNINVDRPMNRQTNGRKFELLCHTLLQAGVKKMSVYLPYFKIEIVILC